MRARMAIIFTALLAVLAPQYAQAYGTQTHAYLTGVAFDLYNASAQEPLPAEWRDYMVEGSRAEDADPRYMNHFYDPVGNRGLRRDPAIDPFYFLGTWPSSKAWAQDGSAQNRPFYKLSAAMAAAESDFSWDAGIRAYARGEHGKAMAILGHILHLIEDLAVPEHTRNDPHPLGCPYEDWTARFDPGHPDPGLRDRLQGMAPVRLDDLNAYFDDLARYTNSHFYSHDTIGIQNGYSAPVSEVLERRNGLWFRMGEDEEGSYPLVQQVRLNRFNFAVALAGDLSLADPNGTVMEAYWFRLAPRAVRYSAGVIDLFLKEGERAKRNPLFASTERESWLDRFGTAVRRAVGAVLDGNAGPAVLAPLPAGHGSPEPLQAGPAVEKEPALPGAPGKEAGPKLPISSSTTAAFPPVSLITVPVPSQMASATVAKVKTASFPDTLVVSLPLVFYGGAPSAITSPSVTEKIIEQVYDSLEEAAAPPPAPTSTIPETGGEGDQEENEEESGDIPTATSTDEGASGGVLILPEPPPIATSTEPGPFPGTASTTATSTDSGIPPEPRTASGAFDRASFPNEYCNFGKATLVPAEDIRIASVDFFAACANGFCGGPDTFRIFDEDGLTMLAESKPGMFGHVELRPMYLEFWPEDRIVLTAGHTYRITPFAGNGQCMVDSWGGPRGIFTLNGIAP